jgi:peptide/nickel transport system substrate-binding protein
MVSSPAAYQKNGLDWVRWNMVGTGPFIQSGFQRDVILKLTRNPDYWDTGYPYLNEVDLLFVSDILTREALFKSGGGEIMDIMPNEATNFQSSEYKILSMQGGTSVLVPDSLNDDSPWSKLAVRQAAEYAIDKEALAKAFGYGYYQAAYQMASPASSAYDANFSGTRKYDVTKAKQLLTEAGYPNGFKTRIIAGPEGLNKDMLVALQSYLGKIGIQCELEFPEAAAYQQYASGTWKNGLLFSPQREWANPNSALNFYFGVPTSSFYKSLKKPDTWTDTLTASVTAPTTDTALMQKCFKQLYDDETVITLFYGNTLWVQKNNLQDTGLGTRGSATYWNPQYAWFSK